MSQGWTNRAPVRERCPHRARSQWGVLVGFAIAVLPWGVWLAQHNECLSLVYDVDALRSQQEQLDEVERRARVELASKKRLGDIETWAERQHGLVRPQPTRVVIVPRIVESTPEYVAHSTLGNPTPPRKGNGNDHRPKTAEVQ